MIIDRSLQVSRQQALSGAGAAASTDVIDLGSLRLVGPGEPIWWVIAARVGLAGTAPTLTIAVQTDDNSGFSSPATLLTSAQLAAADFATGARIVLGMVFNNEKFLRLNYTLGGTTPSATVDAWFSNQHPTLWSAFADAI